MSCLRVQAGGQHALRSAGHERIRDDHHVDDRAGPVEGCTGRLRTASEARSGSGPPCVERAASRAPRAALSGRGRCRTGVRQTRATGQPGTALLDLLDRANGDAPEVFEWFKTPPTFQARVELPDRIEHAEACLFAARRLVVQLTGWLSKKQLAVMRIGLLLEHETRSRCNRADRHRSLAEPTWREDSSDRE